MLKELKVAVEKTLSVVKPDAVEKNVVGEIFTRFEKAGLRIAGARMLWLDRATAAGFYQEHEGKPFFDDLLTYMTSGPIFVQVLAGENAVQKNRDLMGATDPREAAPGTIRADYAETVSANAVHGSDSPKSAEREIAFFFQTNEVYSR